MLEWQGAIRTSSSRLEPVQLRIWGPEPEEIRTSAWVAAPLIRKHPFRIHGQGGIQAVGLAWSLIFCIYGPRLHHLRLVKDAEWPAAFVSRWNEFRRAMSSARTSRLLTWRRGTRRAVAALSSPVSFGDGESWVVMLRAPRLFPLAVPFTSFAAAEATKDAQQFAGRMAQYAGFRPHVDPDPKLRR